ncbi:MAG: DUF58 domain-containing protein [Phycisphaera sp.]|nr:DUF58 domain-containing protein [Phycisphaera sp.]
MAETQTTPKQSLLSPLFMQQLDRLDVMSRKILQGKLQGERRSKKRGQSVEFADYRSYVVGDDLRFIDWNLYARLDKLFLRLFMEEEDLSVSLIFDVSRSMHYGEPRKVEYAQRLAAALGYIGLVNYNRVSVYSFADVLLGQLPNLRGRRPIPQMLEFIADQSRAGEDRRGAGNLSDVLRRFTLMQRQKGVVVLVSDFFDKGELSDALRYLAAERFDAYAIQLLAPQEVDPQAGGVIGDLRLIDMEDADVAEVSVGPALIKRYKANLQAYCQHVRDLCRKRGVMYMVTDTSVPFDTVVLRYLRERGLLG